MKAESQNSLTPLISSPPKTKKPKLTADEEEWPSGCDANPRHPFTVTCGKCEHTFPLEQGLAVDMSAIMMRCPKCNRSIDYNQDTPDEPFQPEDDDGW